MHSTTKKRAIKEASGDNALKTAAQAIGSTIGRLAIATGFGHPNDLNLPGANVVAAKKKKVKIKQTGVAKKGLPKIEKTTAAEGRRQH